MDIKKAKKLLSVPGTTLAVCRGGVLFVSQKSGIAPALDCLSLGDALHGSAAADKIIGKAAAMLFISAGVRELYGEVMSLAAAAMLDKYGVVRSHTILTEVIVNRKGDGICPMEEAVMDISDPSKAEAALRKKLASLPQRKPQT